MPGRKDDELQPVVSLQEFFKRSVDEAMTRQRLEADDLTAFYVVNLLTLYARSDKLFDEKGNRAGLRPLALLLADAADSRTSEQRNAALKRIGDVSLFVAGFFSESLASRLVDIDYYVRMGGSAYGSLSESVRDTWRGRAFGAVFAELAAKFQDFVDVINEVRDCAKTNQDVDVLRLYDVWLRTGSKRAATLLRRVGIEPNRALDASTRH
jgi:hypothetical protein